MKDYISNDKKDHALNSGKEKKKIMVVEEWVNELLENVHI